MAELKPKNFLGVDPGFHGAIGRISVDGQRVSVSDLPVVQADLDRQREFNIPALVEQVQGIARLPEATVGLEFPTTRPGEGAERARRFGHGVGLLEGMLVMAGIAYKRIPPQLWKGRLNLPGKDTPGAVKTSADFFDFYYPEYGHLIRGPKGGLLDGRIDALLIAHFMRMQQVEGLEGMVKKFGKGSDQALLYLLSGGKKRKKSPMRLPFGDS